ncbi:hypothetical protein FHR81_004079 [Actinoalloteichus hoggarensis]|uniref:Uncharacterized protein n=1 Tax=Actinoalloteichus hoggarensis TaxID=1470176 RepID=A0A221WA09_9PSEU|nr:hypothetical protein AHOG_24795 [Actinoalloteichus hoggarensis]MBB5923012.1 hypothetical protein [Actinoalloteichus hoggarensis]
MPRSRLIRPARASSDVIAYPAAGIAAFRDDVSFSTMG